MSVSDALWRLNTVGTKRFDASDLQAPRSELPADVTVISIHPMYSGPQVAVATVLGGPLGGAWLMALNYKRLGAPRKAHAAIVLGLIAMAVVIAIGLVASYGVMRLLVMIPGIVVAGLTELLQGARYFRHVSVRGRRGSNWRVLGVGVVCLPIHLVPIVGAAIIHASVPGHLMMDGNSVLYTKGVPLVEAQKVGHELVELEHDRLAQIRSTVSADRTRLDADAAAKRHRDPLGLAGVASP